MRKRFVSFFISAIMAMSLLVTVLLPVSAYTIGYDGLGPVKVSGGKRDFKWPIPGWYNLQSCFYDHRNHCALDISANTGTNVVASYDGTVIASIDGGTSYYGDGFGNYVVVQHSYTLSTGDTVTLYTRYSHLNSTSVSKGTAVVGGSTIIGKVGQTGAAEGPHLDFQILYGGWQPYQTYSIDPYSNQLLELPSNLSVFDSWDCGKTYYNLVKELYTTPLTYNVTFDAKGGICPITTKAVPRGSAIGELPTPISYYYDFAGWYTEKNKSGEDPVSPSMIISEDTTLYVHWANRLYQGNKITFDAQGGSLPGASASWPISGFNKYRPAGALTVYNCDSDIVDTNPYGNEVTVASDGRVVKRRDYSSSSKLTVPDGGFVLSGHMEGINSAADFVGSIKISDYVAYDTGTMRAYVYKSQNAFTTNQKYVYSGSAYGLLPTPTYNGRSFLGWYTAPTGGTKVTSDSIYSVSKLYAHWGCNHKYTSKVTDPTCTAQGYTTHTCSVCGNSYKDTYTNPLGHSYSYKVVTVPTLSKTGNLTGTCSRCKETNNISLPKLDTTNYNYKVSKAATCTADGIGRYTWKTTTYGTFSFDVTIPKTGHKYTTKVTAPTCTAQGYTIHTCSVCGSSYKDAYTKALGHAWNAGEIIKQPTETQTGIKTYTCTRCKETKTETLPVLTPQPTDPKPTDPKPTEPEPTEPKPTEPEKPLKNPFQDVKKGKFYYDAVLWAASKNITSGVDETHFAPEDKCTRGQVVTFLWRAMGQPEPKGTKCPFADVSSNRFYYKAVLWAVENSVTAGTDPTHFEPEAIVTRGQFVTFLWRAAGKPSAAGASNPFKDLSTGTFYYDAVLWAVKNNITAGTSPTVFSPSDPCTRGQVVTFLWRNFKK